MLPTTRNIQMACLAGLSLIAGILLPAQPVRLRVAVLPPPSTRRPSNDSSTALFAASLEQRIDRAQFLLVSYSDVKNIIYALPPGPPDDSVAWAAGDMAAAAKVVAGAAFAIDLRLHRDSAGTRACAHIVRVEGGYEAPAVCSAVEPSVRPAIQALARAVAPVLADGARALRRYREQLADAAKRAPLVDVSRIYYEFEVARAATIDTASLRLEYPPVLKRAGVEGEVQVEFVVDSDGRVDVASIRVRKSSHELFAAAVLKALRAVRIVPASLRGSNVRQVVQQVFTFSDGRVHAPPPDA